MKYTKVFWILLFFFLVLRVIFIIMFPPFTDESLYIRWGQLMIDNPLFRWASIQYVSRQPLAFWLFGAGAILLKNPIIGARLIMLLINIPTFFITYHLTKKISSEKVSLYAIGILTFTPLFIFTQSTALMDGFLFAISTAILGLYVADWKQKPLYYIFAIAILIGLGLWIKTTALFLVILSIIGIIYKKQNFIRNLVILLVLTCLTLLPLLFQNDFTLIFKEPSSFTLTPLELLNFPIKIWANNIYTTAISLILYLSPLCLSVIYIKKPYSKIAMLWFIIPLCISIFLGTNVLVRYFVFGVIGIIPLIAQGIRNRLMQYIFWTILPAYALFFVFNTPAFFSLFPHSSSERNYAFSWPSGYGIPELITWINTYISNDKPTYIVVADSMGNPSDYLLAYYYFHPTIRIGFVTITTLQEFRKIATVTYDSHIYLATRGSLLIPEIIPYLVPIKLFPKPAQEDFIGLYRIEFPNP